MSSTKPQILSAQLQAAYSDCQLRVRSHYENFPVASLILPKPLRLPISVIYVFARTADDIADEGDLTRDERLRQLEMMSQQLDRIESTGTADEPVFLALADVIERHQLPVQLFRDLLTAFRQDVVKQRYDNFDDVLNYCRHSANPVGRLLLHLIGQDSETQLRQSDAICSALQLINFYQDILQDYDENNRIYFPLDEMRECGISEAHLQQSLCDLRMQSFLAEQFKRTRNMMESGVPLGLNMPGRFGLQLRMMINGGLKVLELLENNIQDCYSRPRLKKSHWLDIGYKSLMKRSV